MNPDKTPITLTENVPGPSCCDRQTLAETAWHAIPEDRVYSLLASSSHGLSADEIQARKQKFGSNTLPSQKLPALWEVILRQFKSPLIYILLVAAIISFGIGEFTDGLFILLVIAVNAIIGAFQEWKAEKNAQALQALLHIMTRVRRDRHGNNGGCR